MSSGINVNAAAYLAETKDLLKTEINAQGGSLTNATPFRDYVSNLHDLDMTDPEVVYRTTRPADWLVLPTPNDQEIYMLYHLEDTTVLLLNQFNFRTDVSTGLVKLEFGTVKNNVFVPNPALTTTTLDYAETHVQLNYADFADTTSDGKHQCMVKITPNTIGASLVRFGVSPSSENNYRYHHNDGCMEISLSSSTMTGFITAVTTDSSTGIRNLRYVTVSSNTRLTSFYLILGYCSSIKCVRGLQYSEPTSLTSAFQGASSLMAVDLPDCHDCTTAASAFNGCTSLLKLRQLDLRNCTNCTSMFAACSILETVDILTSNLLASTPSMFLSCTTLSTISTPINMTNVTSMNGMFYGCESLIYPNMTTEAVDGIISLCGDIGTMFQNCYTMTSLPPFTTALATIFTGLFLNARELIGPIIIDITNMTTNTVTMVQNCRLLRGLTLTWTGNITSYPAGILLNNTPFSIEATTALFNSLPNITSSTSRAITLTSSLCRDQLADGSAESLAIIAIATTKGWTVTL
jgi:hypothetical protein